MDAKPTHQLNGRSSRQGGAAVVAAITSIGKSAVAAETQAKAAGSSPLILADAGKAAVATALGKVSGLNRQDLEDRKEILVKLCGLEILVFCLQGLDQRNHSVPGASLSRPPAGDSSLLLITGDVLIDEA
jgi:hypothetical protein